MQKLPSRTIYWQSCGVEKFELEAAILACFLYDWNLHWCYFVASLSMMIYCCFIYVLIHNMSTKSYYWWSYGLAKLDAAMASFDAKLRRAITSSISRFCRHIMHINVDNNIMYYRGSRGDKITSKWCSILQITYGDGSFQCQTLHHQCSSNISLFT